jgi:hypothetical protein
VWMSARPTRVSMVGHVLTVSKLMRVLVLPGGQGRTVRWILMSVHRIHAPVEAALVQTLPMEGLVFHQETINAHAILVSQVKIVQMMSTSVSHLRVSMALFASIRSTAGGLLLGPTGVSVQLASWVLTVPPI